MPHKTVCNGLHPQPLETSLLSPVAEAMSGPLEQSARVGKGEYVAPICQHCSQYRSLRNRTCSGFLPALGLPDL